MSAYCKQLIKTIVLLLPLTAMTCFAQFSSAVQGNVLDPSGAAVPNAMVTLVNVETNVTQTAKSDAAGVYRFVSLPPGHYTVSATAAGFAGAKVDFTLQTAENRDVPLKLMMGNVATSVMVTTQAPLLDTSDSRLQYTLSSHTLQSLPLANRNPTAVIGITPGVSGALDAQQNQNFYPENFLDASASGRGENGNLYVVDGLDVTSNVRPGVINLTPGAEDVQEESVQTNTYSVQYGRGSGIETLMTTKSGTDHYHGYASEYYTYQKWGARGEFGPTHTDVPNLPPFHTNNMSFGVGGPIVPHHKLFFFATWQPYHTEGSSYGNVFYEDPAFVSFAQTVRPGSPEVQLFTKYPIGPIAGASVFQTAQQLLGSCATPGTDNIPCGLPVIDRGQFSFPNSTNAKQYSVRVDKYFTKDRLYGNFIRNDVAVTGANPRPAFNTTSNYYGFSLQGNETHTFGPNLLNEAIFGYNRIEGFAPQTGQFSVPVVNVSGLGSGWGAGFAQGDYIQHSYHWRDVLTYIHGSHSLKFGYEGWHGDDTAIFQGPYGQPTFQFNNMIDLINNNPYSESGLSYNLLTGAPEPGNYGFSETTAAGFAEDTWKASKRVTVNYGIRYDNYGNPYPTLTGTIAAPFFLGSGSTFAQRIQNGYMKPTSHALTHDLNWNFAPRAGVAWDVTGSGNWVFNGGFGIYHDQITLGNMADILKGNPPNWVSPTFFNNGSTAAPIFGFGTQNHYPFGFPYPAFGGQKLNSKGGIEGSQINVGSVDVNAHSPTTYDWSASLQHAVTRDLVAGAAYVGSHTGGILLAGENQGANQFGYDVNDYPGDLTHHTTCALTTNPDGTQSDQCAGVQTRLNTSFGAINYAYNTARANYNGLILYVRGRFTKRAFVVASYTRSVTKDDATYYFPTADFNQDRFYGNSPFDFPNRFSGGWDYELPGIGDDSGLIGRLTNGWSLAGTVTLQSGGPLTIFTGAPYDVQRINPALPASASNLEFKPDSGDFSADGYNYAFPNVNKHFHIPNTRQAYKNGVFPTCVATKGSNLNNCGPFSLPTFGQQGDEQINDQFRNPGFAQTDATLSKTTHILEGLDLKLRLDAFNAFNQVNFYGLDANAQDGTFGQTNSTHTPRYLQVGATLNF